MPVAAVTAEWLCTRCGSTNLKLVSADATRAKDRCVTCGTKHDVVPGETPVRWDAKLR